MDIFANIIKKVVKYLQDKYFYFIFAVYYYTNTLKI